VHAISTLTSRKDQWGFALALAFALIAGGHWLVGLCYSRGYDFFLWLYNAWLVSDGLAVGNWPDWSSYSAAGQPASKMAGVVDALILSLFTAGIGIETGTRLYAVLLYVVAGMGMYALARYLTKSALGAVVASASYSLSWFLTFTAYYQSYLSNLLSYALMPWCALLFIYAVCRASRAALLAASLMLFISVTSNAQVAVKVVLFVVPLAYVVAVRMESASLRRWFIYSALFCLFAAWWSGFLIAPALMLRQEVLVPGEARGNAFIAPWLVLFWIPMFGLNFALHWATGISLLGRDFLAWAIFSDYIGLSTLAVALASIAFYRRTRDGKVVGLWGLLGAYYFVYFAIVPNLAASAWVGRTHNWSILPTLVLSLLAAYGMRQIAHWAKAWVQPLAAGAMVCALLCIDLGGVSFFLNRLAMTHTPLGELPELVAWKELRAEDEGWEGGSRFFTYNPDHTFYLLPVLLNKAVANVIELRTRSWEYDSYIEHQLQSMRSLDPTYNASESLALLDVEYVDLARKLYAYRGDAGEFERGMAYLQADENLELLLQRTQEAADYSYDAYQKDLTLDKIVAPEDRSSSLSQTIFRNRRHVWGFVPEKAILILGPTRLGQNYFEEITHLPGYRAERLLFVLLPSGEALDEDLRAKFTACITVGESEALRGLSHWDMEQVRAFYATKAAPSSAIPQRRQDGVERALYKVGDNASGQFFFISQQRFVDWHAYGDGRELPVYKAQAGLTAIYLPAGVEEVEYRYEIPMYEWWARIFSLIGALAGLVWWMAGWLKWKYFSSRSPYLAEQMNNGSSERHGKTAELVGR
jgi:hypothetical protein